MTRTIPLTPLRERLAQGGRRLRSLWRRLLAPFTLDFDDFDPEPVEDRDVYEELLRRA